ncbi:sensor histidine kinase [Cohnella terricola]|uniref:histidine kinase n=1 Tax=Cohnella terricola TaxID=1289167 RepID=A0A559JWV2_9BACL|nr:HAMP domain-containing sensor histidine kinase [Cohnella terricola]TVY04372.1 HAMP domain-containing histidine kinase [Cohnella terricola]
MLFVWIALWAVALVLLLADPRSRVNRRLSAAALCGGAGALAATLSEVMIPYIHDSRPSDKIEAALYFVQASSSLTSYYGLPYSFMLFALAYNPPRLRGTARRFISLILLLPIVLCLFLTPGYNEYHPISFSVVVWWAVPYFLAAAAIIVSKEIGHRALSHSHWLICLAVLPPALFTMIMSYVLPALGMLRMWKYNVWFVIIGVVVFLFGLFTYGFLGLRVLVDRRRLDSTLRAVTSGTAILNHAIKNDVGKMRLFTEKMKTYAETTNQPELLEDLAVVQKASSHIQEMIARVHRRTEDLEIRPRSVHLDVLITDTLKPFGVQLGRIKLELDIMQDWQCEIDPAQVGEALNNLISNAIEAMNGEGRLFIALREGKRELTLEITDSGPGMGRAQAVRSLEPFYTTKSGKETNFGLGLPYAYYVMRKHRGSLYIRSKIGVGTSVFMVFPKRSVQAVKPQVADRDATVERSAIGGSN